MLSTLVSAASYHIGGDSVSLDVIPPAHTGTGLHASAFITSTVHLETFAAQQSSALIRLPKAKEGHEAHTSALFGPLKAQRLAKRQPRRANSTDKNGLN
jgi:hypothetical protein